jgi:SAM-dependent methyltransferase
MNIHGSLQDYIDRGKAKRSAAKEEIMSLIAQHKLDVPEFVEGGEQYGVTFEGMTIARLAPWNEPHEYRTALSPDRLYMIKQFAETAPSGLCYECGVFTGGVTRMLLDMGKKVVAFDTFEGIKGAGEFDFHDDGDYNGHDVSEYIAGAEIVKGFVPDTFAGRDDAIAFAHLDMDIYAPTAAALEYIYPRLVEGGIIVLDDYGFWTTPGVRKACDEFKFGKKIYLPTGQMVVFKSSDN